MSIARAGKVNFFSRYRVLIIAIAVSLTWHLFCLSAVKVVTSPLPKSPVRFSKVAFLGPILSRVSMDLRASTASQSMLEMRYREMVSAACQDVIGRDEGPNQIYYGIMLSRAYEYGLSEIIDGSVADEKAEPDFQAE